MASSIELQMCSTLARVAHASSDLSSGASGGQSFERRVFHALEAAHTWEHCMGPDHFDMTLDLVGKTGTHYEFDGAFLTRSTLYVLESKKVGTLTREHVGIFVHKLLDILLAPRDHYAALTIMPILVSAGPRISPNAWLHAVSWGVLLISPQRPTPLEVLAHLEPLPNSSAVIDLRTECERLARRLWRPIDRVIHPSRPDSLTYYIETDQILERDVCHQLVESWEQCVARAPTSMSSAL
jgi:hypothetical protein